MWLARLSKVPSSGTSGARHHGIEDYVDLVWWDAFCDGVNIRHPRFGWRARCIPGAVTFRGSFLSCIRSSATRTKFGASGKRIQQSQDQSLAESKTKKLRAKEKLKSANSARHAVDRRSKIGKNFDSQSSVPQEQLCSDSGLVAVAYDFTPHQLPHVRKMRQVTVM